MIIYLRFVIVKTENKRIDKSTFQLQKYVFCRYPQNNFFVIKKKVIPLQRNAEDYKSETLPLLPLKSSFFSPFLLFYV